MWLFLIFIAVPLIEIALFITVGGWLTLWPTLGLVLLTGIIGTFLVRQQGIRVIEELRGEMQQMRDPLSPMAHGAIIVLAGLLLLTPGFFTDTVGFLLLVPPIRQWVIGFIGARVKVVNMAAAQNTYRADDIMEGEWEDVTTPQEPPERIGDRKPSGWTRH
ncbi:MAG: FxsA family protein [Pseudorhodobacter sp.]